MNNILYNEKTKIITPGSFEMENHYYTKVLNAQLHPMVSFFLNLSNERIIKRYCHLNPLVNSENLTKILEYRPKYLPWAGSDLFHVTTSEGVRQMIVVETNSCPSGQKSMPLLNEHKEKGGYHYLMKNTFKSFMAKKHLPKGKLAVIYDKNFMESSGYAAALADLTGEDVLLVPFYDKNPDALVEFRDRMMYVKDNNNEWQPIKIAFRYVTQKPWNRIPLNTKTLILNPVLACLAGGRNKLIASKAYEMYNAELFESGLQIRTPETIRDVNKDEIPLWLNKFGGHAVIKVPYSNAGQGVYTITNKKELNEFMNADHEYQQFIVQSLVGNYNWSSTSESGKFYHVGTLPGKQNKIFVSDIRMMVCGTNNGFRPLAIYSRRSHTPLIEHLDENISTWDLLGTNLSYKKDNGTWGTDTNRLLIMDRKDFNIQGIGLDDLIEAYIQTVLSVIAIDKMAKNLKNQKGQFRKKLFGSLNNDKSLLDEIIL